MLSLPAIINIGTLLLLIFFIYAILGVYQFGDVMLGGVMSDRINFQNIGNAL